MCDPDSGGIDGLKNVITDELAKNFNGLLVKDLHKGLKNFSNTLFGKNTSVCYSILIQSNIRSIHNILQSYRDKCWIVERSTAPTP